MISAPWLFSGPLLAFGAYYLYRAYRFDPYQAAAFLLLIPFAFFLEHLNIRLHHQYGYSTQLFMLGSAPWGVPLAVCVSWASMIFIAMRTSDRWGLGWAARPWTDGLIAVSIDLVGDPVSSTTRVVTGFDGPCPLVPAHAPDGMGVWTWCVLPDEGTWIGVPWDNYFGWFVVVLLVSYAVRGASRWGGGSSAGRRLLLLAGLLLLAFAAVFVAIQLFLLGPFQHPWLAGGVVAALLSVGTVAVIRQRNSIPGTRWDWGLLSLPLVSHVTSLGYFFTQGPGLSRPLVAVGFVAAATASILLLVLPYRSAPGDTAR